jgi:hypothetical protein
VFILVSPDQWLSKFKFSNIEFSASLQGSQEKLRRELLGIVKLSYNEQLAIAGVH